MQYVLKVTNIYKNILLHKEVAISVIFKMGDDFFFHCIKMVFTKPCKKYQGYQNRLILIISHHLKKIHKYGNKTY